MRVHRYFVFACMALIGIAGWFFINRLGGGASTFGAETDPTTGQTSYAPLIIGYLATLFGAVLGTFFRELQAVKQRGEESLRISTFLPKVAGSVDLWLSVMASPIAYAVIWRSLDPKNLPGLITVAVQNGLFCTVVASSFMARPPQGKPTDGG